MTHEKALLAVVLDPLHEGMRLDAFLAQSTGESRAFLTKLIKDGMVRCGEHLTKPSQAVKLADVFTVAVPGPKAASLVPQNIALDILFSDEHMAVINKPRGMIVHPGAGVVDGTLCNALMYHFPDMNIGNQERPGIVHRLDKNTSGAIIIAKTQKAHQILSDDFKERRIKKYYRAFCHGEVKQMSRRLITGHVRHPHHRLKFFTKLPPPAVASANVRLAHTDFSVVRRACFITELYCELHTGRTHQIRAHLADIGHPLLGDALYGGKRVSALSVPQELKDALDKLFGQALHAERLEFLHPITKCPIDITAALPEELLALSKAMDAQLQL